MAAPAPRPGLRRVAVVVGSARAAHDSRVAPTLAADLCIDSVLFSPEQLVGKNFKVPGKNTCKAFHGFFTADVSPGGMVVGTGCTTANGALFRLHVTSHAADLDATSSVACNFVLPGMTTGNCRVKSLNPSNEIVNRFNLATASACLRVPVP